MCLIIQVEMDAARLRASTHIFQCFLFCWKSVEMDVARLRALTQFHIATVDIQVYGRNGCSPIEGTDTILRQRYKYRSQK